MKYFSKFFGLTRKIFNRSFILIYIFISQVIVLYLCVFVIKTSFSMALFVIYLSLFLVYRILNSRKYLNQTMLDDGYVPFKPIIGLPVNLLIKQSGNSVGIPSHEYLEPIPISILCWLSFCVKAVGKSGKQNYKFHIQLIDLLKKEGHEELLPWVDYLYEEYKFKIPKTTLPDNLNSEDFK